MIRPCDLAHVWLHTKRVFPERIRAKIAKTTATMRRVSTPAARLRRTVWHRILDLKALFPRSAAHQAQTTASPQGRTRSCTGRDLQPHCRSWQPAANVRTSRSVPGAHLLRPDAAISSRQCHACMWEDSHSRLRAHMPDAARHCASASVVASVASACSGLAAATFLCV